MDKKSVREELPLITVIIPTYNRKNVLPRAINSVLEQTYKNLEVIVVDDASDDGTEEIVREYTDSRIFYIRNEVNVGPSKARNVGIEKANGEWIAFQDSDDWWYPDKLELQYQAYLRNKTVGLIYCAYEYITDNNSVRVPGFEFKEKELSGNILESLLSTNKIGTPTMLLKKEVIHKVGTFEESIEALEDWELALKISKEYKVLFVEKVLVKAYGLEGGVNDKSVGAWKHVRALYYILCQYWKLFNDKQIFSNIMHTIFMCYSRLDNKEKEMCKELLIPQFISNAMIFQLIVEEQERAERFKMKYNLAMKFIPEEDFRNKFDKLITKNGINTIAVYGYGVLGKQVIRIIENSNCELKYVIDKNLISSSYVVKRMEDNFEQVDAIIISIPDKGKKICKEIETKIHTQIITLEDMD